MTFRKFSNFTMLLVVLMLLSCSSNIVRIAKFTPTGEVKDFQTFSVTFSHDIAPKDKMDQWLSGEYMQFTPKVTGRYKWTTANTLIFSPDKPLKPEQNYEVKFNKDLIMVSAPPETKGRFNSFDFHTPDFSAQTAEIFWKNVPKAEYKLTVQANLKFNYEVEPSELKKYLEIYCDSKKIDNFTIVSEKSSDVIALNFGDLPQTKDAQSFKIVVKKGLNSTIKKTPLEKDFTFKSELPPIQRLAITDVKSGVIDDQLYIEIATTQQVDKEKVAQYLEFTPKISNPKIKVSEEGIRIEGDYEPKKDLKLVVKSGLPGLYGGILENEYEENISFSDMDGNLRFAERKGQYLVRGGLENIKIEGINVADADVEVFEVFKNNMTFFFANNYSYDRYRYDDDYNYDDTQDFTVDDYGKSLYKEKIHFNAEDKNTIQSATINMKKALNQRFKGIYVVKITSDKDYWMRDAKIISISDIGIIVKRSGTDMYVFTNSLATTNPLANANVTVISKSNQTLATATTDASGVAHFSDIDKSEGDFDARLIVVEQGDDFNFLDLRTMDIETSRFDVGGKLVESGFYDTYLYAERNIYRPGETAHLSGIIRNVNMGVVKDIPIVVKIISPTGRIFNTYQKTLNEQGSFEVEVELPDFAQTGTYIAEVYTGNDKLMASYKFHVEEFMPDKLRVNLETPKKEFFPADTVTVNVKSEYFFGAPAAGNKFETDVRLTHAPFRSKLFPKHDFSKSSTQNTNIENSMSEGELDTQGNGEATYAIPSEIAAGGYLEGTAFVSVFDGTGRTVNKVTDFQVYPKKEFIGIQRKGYYYGINQLITWSLAAVNYKDKSVNKTALAKLIRYEWQTILTKNESNGKYAYKSVKKEIEVFSKQISINGSKDFSFEVDRSGEYQLRIASNTQEQEDKDGFGDYVYEDFYAYGWSSTNASSFEVSKEGQIEMVADKASYQPGETAKILLSTPFTGKMLICVERDNVMKYFYVKAEKNATEISIPIEGDYLPNIYISATLFKSYTFENQSASASPFLVGHGFLPIMVEKPSNKIPVVISAPEKIKPNTTQTINIKTIPNAFVTVAAVDEGVLQVKNFHTPEPYSYMYSKRQLAVTSYDMYEWILPELKEIKSSVAGSDDYESARKQNPIKSKRFKLMSFWSGIQKADSKGDLQIKVNVPQYNGEVRIMAVAYQDAKFGSSDKAMKVSDDVVIMPSVPRELTLGDSLTIPVSVMNTSEKKGGVSVSLSVEGPLKLVSNGAQSLTLDSKGSGNVSFTVTSREDVGVGKMIFKTSGLGVTGEEIEIAIRPASASMTEGDGGEIKAGENVSLNVPTDFVAGTQTTTLTVSTFPATKFAKNLKYLIGYPHGCIEQTTSKLFPQLYYNELAQVCAPEMYKKGTNPNYFVREGISKLFDMMNYEGKFSYWQGGNDYTWWGSCYATHFLVEAKKAGFEVNEVNLSAALDNLAKEANSKATESYITYNEKGRQTVQIAPKEAIYAIYVLALAGKSDASLMNYYRARTDLLSGDSKYLLAGAYALAKNWNAYNELLPKSFTPERTDRNVDNFDSEIRANALMLNVLMDVDPTNSQVPLITKYLAGRMKDCYSTQDNAWAFLALGKAAGKMANSKVKIDVFVNGKLYKSLDKAHEVIRSDDLNGKAISLKASGTGSTYFYWNTEGVKKTLQTQNSDKEIAIRRTYLTRKGAEINNYTFNQGDLIVCKIELKGGQRSAERLVISDLVPSGFEIENPRLTPSADLSWVASAANKFTPEYMDVRDDRVILFTNVQAKETKTYYYLIRVVNMGKFMLPAITAESMYEPEVRSTNGARTVIVKG